MPIDTFNRFLVASNGDGVVLLRPAPKRLSKEEALNLAAYLVCCSLATDEEWSAVLTAVRNT